MDTKHTTIHNSTQRQIIKHFTTPSPYITTSIFTLTFIVKAINLSNLAGLVVSSNKRDAVGIADFESE